MSVLLLFFYLIPISKLSTYLHVDMMLILAKTHTTGTDVLWLTLQPVAILMKQKQPNLYIVSPEDCQFTKSE